MHLGILHVDLTSEGGLRMGTEQNRDRHDELHCSFDREIDQSMIRNIHDPAKNEVESEGSDEELLFT
jgi:hypothetical protein